MHIGPRWNNRWQIVITEKSKDPSIIKRQFFKGHDAKNFNVWLQRQLDVLLVVVKMASLVCLIKYR